MSLFHYVTYKYIIIKDKRLGIAYYCLAGLILLYTVVQIFVNKAYLQVCFIAYIIAAICFSSRFILCFFKYQISWVGEEVNYVKYLLNGLSSDGETWWEYNKIKWLKNFAMASSLFFWEHMFLSLMYESMYCLHVTILDNGHYINTIWDNAEGK